jgi:hypothetical protein
MTECMRRYLDGKVLTESQVDDDIVCTKMARKIAFRAREECTRHRPISRVDVLSTAHNTRRRCRVPPRPKPNLHLRLRTLEHKISTTGGVEGRTERIRVGGGDAASAVRGPTRVTVFSYGSASQCLSISLKRYIDYRHTRPLHDYRA